MPVISLGRPSPLVLHCCVGQLCFLKAVRPDSHLRSGSMNLYTHLRALFLCWSFGRRFCLCKAWIQEVAILTVWSCVLWDFSGLESACRVPCDHAGWKAKYKMSIWIYFFSCWGLRHTSWSCLLWNSHWCKRCLCPLAESSYTCLQQVLHQLKSC